MLQYSFSLTTFSPSGKLVQIEYALNAVEAGATSLGIKATNGVVIATERKVGTSRRFIELAIATVWLVAHNKPVQAAFSIGGSHVQVRLCHCRCRRFWWTRVQCKRFLS